MLVSGHTLLSPQRGRGVRGSEADDRGHFKTLLPDMPAPAKLLEHRELSWLPHCRQSSPSPVHSQPQSLKILRAKMRFEPEGHRL